MYQFDPQKVDIHQQIELEKTQAETRLDVQNILCRRGPLKGVENVTSDDLKAFQNPKLYDTFQRAMLFNESPHHSILKMEAEGAGQSVRDYVKSNPKAIYMDNREIDNIVDVLKETNLLDRKLGRPATEKEIQNYAKGEFLLDVLEGINPKNPGPNTEFENKFLNDSFEKEQKVSKNLFNLSSQNLLYDREAVHSKRMEIDDYYRSKHAQPETVAAKVEAPKIEAPKTEPNKVEPKTEVPKIEPDKVEPKTEAPKIEPDKVEPKTFGEKFKMATKNFIEKVGDLVSNTNVQTLKSSVANMFNKLADKIVPDEPLPSISINKSAMKNQKLEEVSKTNAFKPK